MPTSPSDTAVRTATGRGWDDWIAALKAEGAEAWSHKQIVAWLGREDGLSGWWRQMIAVGFERSIGRRVEGQTADGRFQIGVTRTVAQDPEGVWSVLTSPAGTMLWLGTMGVELAAGSPYRADDGAEGDLRVVRAPERLRFTRREGPAAPPTTIQIALTAAPRGGTAITFHHEGLADAAEREAMRLRWRNVADQIARLLGDLAESSAAGEPASQTMR